MADATTLLQLACLYSNEKWRERLVSWRDWSLRVGASKRRSALGAQASALSRIEVLICQMEEEFFDILHEGELILNDASASQPSIDAHVIKQALRMEMSALWISSIYEVFRIHKLKNKSNKRVLSAYHNLNLVRVGIHKHEIAGFYPGDRKNSDISLTSDGEVFESYQDLGASHILPTETSERGSVKWLCYDASHGNMVWIERRQLADDLLESVLVEV